MSYISDFCIYFSFNCVKPISTFLYICEYLGVTPMEFFNEDKATTLMQQKAIDYIYSMSDEDVSLMIGFIERMKAAK